MLLCATSRCCWCCCCWLLRFDAPLARAPLARAPLARAPLAAAVAAAVALLCACYLLRFQPPLLRLLPPGLDWVWVAAQTRAFSTSNLTQNSTHRAPERGWWFHSKRVGAADSGPPCVNWRMLARTRASATPDCRLSPKLLLFPGGLNRTPWKHATHTGD